MQTETLSAMLIYSWTTEISSQLLIQIVSIVLFDSGESISQGELKHKSLLKQCRLRLSMTTIMLLRRYPLQPGVDLAQILHGLRQDGEVGVRSTKTFLKIGK